MANARGKQVDKTFLSLDNAERRGFLHRDYIAHCFRWTHAAKIIQRLKRAVVLDVGCGKEMPFPKLIYSSKLRPLHYVGLDVGDWPLPEMLEKVTFPCDKLVGDIADCDSFEDLGFTEAPNLITCFEVMEHVEWEHCLNSLETMRNICAHNGTLLISTPCYNLKDVADNHVNEMTYEAFGSALEHCGWSIRGHWGTFASQTDYKAQLIEDGYGPMFDAMHAYYDSNVLSVIFAPLYPGLSRNVIWECFPHNVSLAERMFPRVEELSRPFGSSEACQ